jgi:hypothetical protein
VTGGFVSLHVFVCASFRECVVCRFLVYGFLIQRPYRCPSYGQRLLSHAADFINNDNWEGGYTGTMLENGMDVPCPGLPGVCVCVCVGGGGGCVLKCVYGFVGACVGAWVRARARVCSCT